MVSLGQERHNVPDLTGMTTDSVQATLDKEHLTMGTVTEAWSDDVEAGQVIKSNPDTGAPLPRDTAVNVIVSKGPKPVNVDDYTNKPAAGVVKALEKAGITVNQIQDYSPTVPAGNVMSQDQAPGSVLHRGDTINLTVSQGVPPVQVPDVFNRSEQDATQLLQQAGFQVNSQRSNLYIGFNRVSSQSAQRRRSAAAARPDGHHHPALARGKRTAARPARPQPSSRANTSAARRASSSVTSRWVTMRSARGPTALTRRPCSAAAATGADIASGTSTTTMLV